MIKSQKITLFMHSSSYQSSQIVEYFIKDNGIYKLDLTAFKKLSKNEQSFLIELFSEQFEIISEEWEIIKIEIVDRNKNIKCELCNQSHLKIIATIENKINKKKLKVGSTCIETYNRITTDGKTIKESKHDFIRTKNIEYVETSIENFYQDYLLLKQHLTNTCVIYDPIRVHMRRSIRRVDTLLKDKNISKQDIITAIQNLKNSKLKFEEWIKFSEEDTLGINKDIQNWVSLHGSELLIKQLSKYGRITKETFIEIGEINFIKRMIELIRTCVLEHKILIYEIKTSNFGIKLQNGDIKYSVNYKKLVEVYIDKFMMQKPFKIGMDYLFTISDLILEYQNIRRFLDALLGSDLSYQYMINKNDYIGIVEIRKDQNYSLQNIYVIPLQWVIKRFKGLMFTNIIFKEVLNFFIARGCKIKFENFKNFDEEQHKKMQSIRL